MTDGLMAQSEMLADCWLKGMQECFKLELPGVMTTLETLLMMPGGQQQCQDSRVIIPG